MAVRERSASRDCTWYRLRNMLDVARNQFGPFNPFSAQLNPICHLLALLGAHHILHVSRVRVKKEGDFLPPASNQAPIPGSSISLFAYCTDRARTEVRRKIFPSFHIYIYIYIYIDSLYTDVACDILSGCGDTVFQHLSRYACHCIPVIPA